MSGAGQLRGDAPLRQARGDARPHAVGRRADRVRAQRRYHLLPRGRHLSHGPGLGRGGRSAAAGERCAEPARCGRLGHAAYLERRDHGDVRADRSTYGRDPRSWGRTLGGSPARSRSKCDKAGAQLFRRAPRRASTMTTNVSADEHDPQRAVALPPLADDRSAIGHVTPALGSLRDLAELGGRGGHSPHRRDPA